MHLFRPAQRSPCLAAAGHCRIEDEGRRIRSQVNACRCGFATNDPNARGCLEMPSGADPEERRRPGATLCSQLMGHVDDPDDPSACVLRRRLRRHHVFKAVPYPFPSTLEDRTASTVLVPRPPCPARRQQESIFTHPRAKGACSGRCRRRSAGSARAADSISLRLGLGNGPGGDLRYREAAVGRTGKGYP